MDRMVAVLRGQPDLHQRYCILSTEFVLIVPIVWRLLYSGGGTEYCTLTVKSVLSTPKACMLLYSKGNRTSTVCTNRGWCAQWVTRYAPKRYWILVNISELSVPMAEDGKICSKCCTQWNIVFKPYQSKAKIGVVPIKNRMYSGDSPSTFFQGLPSFLSMGWYPSFQGLISFLPRVILPSKDYYPSFRGLICFLPRQGLISFLPRLAILPFQSCYISFKGLLSFLQRVAMLVLSRVAILPSKGL